MQTDPVAATGREQDINKPSIGTVHHRSINIAYAYR